ncbi:retrovirus-related Pol polyprotein from transposon 412 [Trichonephila clavipes]|nr:retrovirus-related Pol polyprotein from transposon 412 [Trichonephila clavipes]
MIDSVIRKVTTPSTSESDSWSEESVPKDQLTDPGIKPIRDFLHLRNGVLYCKWDSDNKKHSGPLPRSSDCDNSILFVMDYSTKCPEVYPIPDQEAPTVAEDCNKKLPPFLLAYRSAVQETTIYFPSQMLFGRDLCLPTNLLLSRLPDTPLTPEKWVEKLQPQMEEMHHLARDRIGMASEKMKT